MPASPGHIFLETQPGSKRLNGFFFQPKLTINESNDIYELQANAMSKRVLGMTEKNIVQAKFFKPLSTIQRQCADCKKEEKKLQRKETNNEAKTADEGFENYINNLDNNGQPMASEVRNFYEPRFGFNFSNVRIHADQVAAKSAQSINALAYTSGNHIVFNNGQYSSVTDSGKKLLAHELTHVVQQNKSGEAPLIQQQSAPKRRQSPHDKATVAMAKARLAKLEPLLQQAEDRQFTIEADRLRVRADRKRLDENAADLAMPSKLAQEESNLARLNRKPLTITQNSNEISFGVKFQVLFEDASMIKRFDDLKKNVLAGIDLVWKQTLTGDAFGGRKFNIVPSFTLIKSRSVRDHNFWLINVRMTDKAKVAYPGCTLEEPDPGFATSVTDPLCDGGVMSIPPLHIGMPGVLGHELLHLFGLIDRYFTTTSVVKGKKPVLETEQVRETPGRKDPLGAQDATILREDLGYLFDKLGVYSKESEQSDAIITYARPLVTKLKRIVELGYDPDSLLPIRQDFNDKIIKDAEDL